MIPYILTDSSLTVVIDAKSMTMDSTNPSFALAKETLASEDWEKLQGLFDTAKAVVDYTSGSVNIENGIISYKGHEVHNHVVDRILDFMGSSLPYKPLINFLEKLMENPSRRAVEELYRFLEHKSMPLTPDGNFLAYKGVQEDFTDWHSGHFGNKVGDINEMPRNRVCDDANLGCSSGFHAGSLDYARSYGNGGHLMIVEVNPADVVSVPNDSDFQKLRMSKYKVVSLFEKKLEQPMCDEYGEYSNYEDEDEDDFNFSQESQVAYKAGYEAAQKEVQVKYAKQARDAKGKFLSGNDA